MLRSLIVAAALVACVTASTTPGPNIARQTEQRCKNEIQRNKWDGICPTFQEAAAECGECERLRKVSAEYVNGECCPTYQCVRDESDPCCGVSCKATNLDEATDICNQIHPDNQVWNELSPYFGAMVAKKVDVADPARGKCCDKYACETNKVKLCENTVERTPCVTEATCPACYHAETSEATDVDNGKCCPTIVCVRDNACMCDNREGVNQCPMPTCDPDFEYEVVLAEATYDACCPVWTCQRNLNAICAAKWESYEYTTHDGTEMTGFDPVDTPQQICGPCQEVKWLKQANPASGRCFPEWKCVPVADKCCQSTLDFGEGVRTADGLQECTDFQPDCNAMGPCMESVLVRPRNENKGRCCDTYSCGIDHQCACGLITCPFVDAVEYKSVVCPDKPLREESAFFGDNNAKIFYEVDVQDANPAAGKCCPTYRCRETAAKKVKDLRLAKRKAKRASRKAAKAAASTTARP
jgi:hypothetical protein